MQWVVSILCRVPSPRASYCEYNIGIILRNEMEWVVCIYLSEILDPGLPSERLTWSICTRSVQVSFLKIVRCTTLKTEIHFLCTHSKQTFAWESYFTFGLRVIPMVNIPGLVFRAPWWGLGGGRAEPPCTVPGIELSQPYYRRHQ